MPTTDKISIYSGELTAQGIIAGVTKIKMAFPGLPMGFYDVFAERLKDNNFTDERLKDAINYVIDNFTYPMPSIANFISFDKTIKFRTYDEMCKEAMTYDKVWKDWLPVKMPGMPKTIWVFANDVEKYKLNDYLVK